MRYSVIRGVVTAPPRHDTERDLEVPAFPQHDALPRDAEDLLRELALVEAIEAERRAEHEGLAALGFDEPVDDDEPTGELPVDEGARLCAATAPERLPCPRCCDPYCPLCHGQRGVPCPRCGDVHCPLCHGERSVLEDDARAYARATRGARKA